MSKGTVISKKAARRRRLQLWCNEPGCCKLASSWETRNQWENFREETLHLCYEHMLKSGFCMLCGYFRAGSEDFDFSPMPGYCSECRDQIRSEYGDDEYDDWDDEYGFMNPYYEDDQYADDALDWDDE